MGGIAGILDHGDYEDRRRRVGFMTRAPVHRGADDEGSFRDGPVSLEFNRLAVIDVETGRQLWSLLVLTHSLDGEMSA